MSAPRKVTVVAHPNIALAKYWGKVPGLDNAPAVPSLSVTLAGMTTTTRAYFDSTLSEDSFQLDGKAASGRPLQRAIGLLDRIRREAGISAHAKIISENDFPTAAGLASSASGFAALALAAARAAGLDKDMAWVSDLARRCSASSARSLFGGFVELRAGNTGDDANALHPARQVAPENHLPLCVLVAVTSDEQKKVPSSGGMNHTAETSPYFKSWCQHAPSLFEEIRTALLAKDLPRMGDALEASSFAMHASAIAARPSVLYWNPASVGVLQRVRQLREQGLGGWLSMDAGPHVKVFCAPGDAPKLSAELAQIPGVLRVLRTSPGPGARVVNEGAHAQ